ncbi:MAG: tetratricopeptide repeat protein [Candidatus Hodarchaeales archaeon]|jgi:tetratricopeptide (TPR) repeat protein
MTKESEGLSDQLLRAKEHIQQGRVDEARPLIEALEKEVKLPPDAHLTWQLLKGQLLLIRGNYEESYQLAKQVWKTSQEQGNLLQAADAAIVMAEVLVEEKADYKTSLDVISQGGQLLTTVTGESPQTLGQRKAAFIYLQGRNSLFQGDYDQALVYLRKSLSLREELGNKYEIALSLRSIGVAHGNRFDFDQALDYHQQALPIFQEIGNKEYSALCLTNISAYYQRKGESDRALEYVQQGLALFQKLENKRMIGYSQEAVGSILLYRGEFTRALDYYRQALRIAEEDDHKWQLISVTFSLGFTYLFQGNLDRALEHMQRSSALSRELGQKEQIHLSYGIGLIHWQQGALEQAREALGQFLGRGEEIDSPRVIAAALFRLTSVTLDQGARDQAEQYLQRLKQIKDQTEDKFIDQEYRLAAALVLKASPRLRDKMQAQEIFEEVANEEMVDFEWTQIAMVHLCELLLDELKTYGEVAVLQEAKILANKLYGLSQERQSFWLMVEVLILLAKLALIEGDLTAATQFLDQAKLTTEEKNLELLTQKVIAEKQSLEDQYETWLTLIQSSGSFQERLEQAKVADYLKDVEKVISLQGVEPSS